MFKRECKGFVEKMMFNTSISVLLLLVFPAVISEVVDFSKCSEFFFEGKSPNITGMLVKSQSQNNQYKTICQKYKNAYRFATLYDTTNRIPVFSAYTVTVDKEIKRPENTWMNEPQLEVSSDEMGMPYENQATDEDFFNNSYSVNRGHLFPSCHSGDEVIAGSTFTYTNIVPQKISFNSGSWNRMEIETIKLMSVHCRDKKDNKVLAHVLTGAVLGKNKLKLKYRVTIPSFMWMTFCCYNNKSPFSKAYWAPNEDEKGDIRINEITLQELQENLIKNNTKVTELFYKHCT
ncbi:putative endonuclease domain-containing 1 protein-like [Triplophysa rosa]|uniref:Endonuclease domain-containing 1 protein-like n=1 Tax=Triplophysa rosa TaxID=992332 RepID=A0A9W8C5H9_TRIRA|nr:putative endonuclease domain-containing 1 protein-like [Triplophysa rosa]